MQELWQHQKDAIEKARLLKWYALFFEMGTGKTRTTIEIVREKFNAKGGLLRTIIFCPPIVVPNWKDEWLKYSKIDPTKVVLLQGEGKKRFATFQKEAWDGDTAIPKIFVTNYETLLMKPIFAAFLKWAPEILVFDESHKLKEVSAKRSKQAYQLANPYDKPNRRALPKAFTYLLSGSPILNSPMDVFQQFRIMDGGHTFGWNFIDFRNRFFVDRNAGMLMERYFPNWEPKIFKRDGVDAVAEINRRIFTAGMRVEKKDCLDLPPEVSVEVKVGMTRDQGRLYEEMRKEFITFYRSKACTATLAITKALRLMQITSGFLAAETPGDDEPAVQIPLENTPKIEALKGLLKEIIEQEQKVLVWAVFRYNYQQIRKVLDELKIKYVEVHGDVSDVKKREAVKAFNEDKNISVFLGHPGSGGIGINLTSARYSIFYSRTFSLEHYQQARARNHRGGSREAGHENITHYDLICEDTIDELALKKLANKQDLSDRLLADLTSELEQQN